MHPRTLHNGFRQPPRHVVAALLSLALLALCAPAWGRTGPYTLFAAGDLMVARWSHYPIVDEGPGWPLGEIRALTMNADVAMANLECVVAATGDYFYKGDRKLFAYRARPETLDVIVNAGFDLVATANNHSMDFGPEALSEQIELLDATGIAHAGSGRDLREAFAPAYVKVGDVMLAVLGMEDLNPLTGATESRGGVAHVRGPASRRRLERALAQARRHADLVILSPHWGKNWTDNPTPARIRWAHELIDAGFDAIIGHSAHQLHGIEVYKGCPILYDMGSLLFDRVSQGRMRFGAGFVLEFDRRGFRRVVAHPIRLHRSRTVRARGSEVERVHARLAKLSLKLDPEFEFERQGDAFVVNLERRDPPPPPEGPPDTFTVAGSARRLPATLRGRHDPKVVRDAPPEWARTPAIALGRGILVLGSRTAEAVRPGRGFVHEVALKVPGPLQGRWFSRLVGKQRDGNALFRRSYPFADGAYIPELWKAGQVVVDRTFAWSGDVPEGIYDLYWGLQNRRRERLPESSASRGAFHNLVKLGSILITNKAPEGPAGVKWDGRLTPAMRRDLGLAQPPPPPRSVSRRAPLPTLALLAAARLAIALGAGWVGVRAVRRRRARGE